MIHFDVWALLAVPVLAVAAFWCWSEVKRTARNWRVATFTTVCVAVAAAIVSEVAAGGAIRGGWRGEGFGNVVGAVLAGVGWVGAALTARSRRRR